MGRLIALALTGVVWTSSVQAAPQRVVSLNLCTDELVLQLAAPHQIASISFLGADINETRLAARATALHRNNGRLTSVVPLKPDLVITGGGNQPFARELAAKLKLRVLDLPPPTTINEVRRNVRQLAAALGRKATGEALLRRYDDVMSQAVPYPAQSGLLINGGGYTVAADGLAASYLRAAGITQMHVRGERVDIEQLVRQPPAILIETRYRSQQVSNYQRWFTHPALRALPREIRHLKVDGRPWTCLGPDMVSEVLLLRKALAR